MISKEKLYGTLLIIITKNGGLNKTVYEVYIAVRRLLTWVMKTRQYVYVVYIVLRRLLTWVMKAMRWLCLVMLWWHSPWDPCVQCYCDDSGWHFLKFVGYSEMHQPHCRILSLQYPQIVLHPSPWKRKQFHYYMESSYAGSHSVVHLLETLLQWIKIKNISSHLVHNEEATAHHDPYSSCLEWHTLHSLSIIICI